MIKESNKGLGGLRIWGAHRYPDHELISVADAAWEKGYSPSTIRKWCKENNLTYVTKKRQIYIVKDYLYWDIERKRNYKDEAQYYERSCESLSSEVLELKNKIYGYQNAISEYQEQIRNLTYQLAMKLT